MRSPRHSPEMARKVKLSQQMAKDWNKVFESLWKGSGK
jgi:hypothetical protein